MTQYFCESAAQRLTSTQKTYLSLTLTDTKEKFTVSIWDAPSTVKVSDFQGRVLQFTSIQEKNGFKNAAFESISVVDKDMLPKDSPLRQIKTETDIKPDNIVKAAEAFKALMPERWQRFMDFIDIRAMVDSFGISPAGKEVHHTIKGGLREHVYEMLAMYWHLAKSHPVKELRHEFVVFGILFHDIGKTLEYDPETRELKEEMSLLGHIFIGARMLQNLCDEYNRNTTEEFHLTQREIECVVHCVLAHHSQHEWGSPVTPAIPEAWVLYSVDELSGKLNQFKNAVHMQKSFFLGTNVIKETL